MVFSCDFRYLCPQIETSGTRYIRFVAINGNNLNLLRSEVNSPRYEIAFIDLEFVDYSHGRTTFKWPFKGYLFFVQSVQDTAIAS